MTPQRSGRCWLALAAVLATGPAAAHSPVPGLGVFYSGVLHPLLAPSLGLAVAALGLWLGQGGAGRRAGAALGVYALALLLGLGLQRLWGEVAVERLLLLCGAVAGGLVALAWRAPGAVALSLAGACGLAAGWASGPSGVAGQDLALMLAGTVLGALGLPAWLAAMVRLTQRVPAPWLGVAVRVLGSWLAAAALLVLALSFAPVPRAA